MPCIYLTNVSSYQEWNAKVLAKFMADAKISCGDHPNIFITDERLYSVGWSKGRVKDFRASITSLVQVQVIWHVREEKICGQMAALIHKLLIDHGFRDTDITFHNMPKGSFYINGKLVK